MELDKSTDEAWKLSEDQNITLRSSHSVGDESEAVPTSRSLADLRILIPESFKVGNSNYLDLHEQPVAVAELQRAGLFLLTQLQEALAAHEKWVKLIEEFSALTQSHEQLSAALHGTEAAIQELLATNTALTEIVVGLRKERDALQVELDNERAVRLLDQEIAGIPSDQQ